jgi:hypothetical protein
MGIIMTKTAAPVNPFPTLESAERDRLLQEWQQAKEMLDGLKETEMSLRKAVIKNLFPACAENPDTSGTYNYELGNGFIAKAVFKLSYKVSDEAALHAEDALTKLGNDGPFVADRIFKWKPDLSLTEYKQLSEAHKKIVDHALTVSPGTPSFEISAPKGKK